MWSLMRPIGAILCSVALLQLGSGLLNTLLAVTANGQSFSTIWIGFIMSGMCRFWWLGNPRISSRWCRPLTRLSK
jgi:hypothetical protein